MAACDQANPTQGYQCEFVESVPSDYFCRKCKLVARSLTFPSCCGETFCLGCIDGFLQEGKSCPVCEKENFTIQQQVRYQKMVRNLPVYCSLKERGCVWKGPLEKLDTHLDPEQDDCQYVDTKCPLNCQQTIPKNKVEQHMVEECAKRDFVCQHCNFKGTYEEVTYKHLPECKYFPLQCPNLCGVTCDREDMVDHMKICRLEEVACDFKDLGCDERVPREEQDEHLREYSHKHLMLAASLALKNKQDFTKEIQEQREKHEAEEQELKRTLEEQEVKLQAQEKKIEEQKKILEEQKKILEEQKKILEEQGKALESKVKDVQEKCQKKLEEKMVTQNEDYERKLKSFKAEIENKNNQDDKNNIVQQQEEEIAKLKKSLETQNQTLKSNEEAVMQQKKKLEEQEAERKKWQDDLQVQVAQHTQLMKLSSTKVDSLEEKVPKLTDMCNYLGNFERTFEVRNFSKEKEKDKPRDWKSPSMYTHMCGYKFCIGMDANGRGGSHGEAIYAELYVMPGEYDSLLKWPAKASFTLELINQRGGKNVKYNTAMKKWEKPELTYKCLSVFPFTEVNSSYCFMEHSKLNEFLFNDTLKFCTNVTLH